MHIMYGLLHSEEDDPSDILFPNRKEMDRWSKTTFNWAWKIIVSRCTPATQG